MATFKLIRKVVKLKTYQITLLNDKAKRILKLLKWFQILRNNKSIIPMSCSNYLYKLAIDNTSGSVIIYDDLNKNIISYGENGNFKTTLSESCDTLSSLIIQNKGILINNYQTYLSQSNVIQTSSLNFNKLKDLINSLSQVVSVIKSIYTSEPYKESIHKLNMAIDTFRLENPNKDQYDISYTTKYFISGSSCTEDGTQQRNDNILHSNHYNLSSFSKNGTKYTYRHYFNSYRYDGGHQDIYLNPYKSSIIPNKSFTLIWTPQTPQSGWTGEFTQPKYLSMYPHDTTHIYFINTDMHSKILPLLVFNYSSSNILRFSIQLWRRDNGTMAQYLVNGSFFNTGSNTKTIHIYSLLKSNINIWTGTAFTNVKDSILSVYSKFSFVITLIPDTTVTFSPSPILHYVPYSDAFSFIDIKDYFKI